LGLSLVHSRGYAGVEARLITVEVHLSGGLPSMPLVGLPETAVRDSKDRVRAALLNILTPWQYRGQKSHLYVDHHFARWKRIDGSGSA